MRRVAPALLLLIALADTSRSQSRLTPLTQGTVGQGNVNPAARRHVDLLGKPCIDIDAFSRAHISNPRVFDHILLVKNSCIQRIKIKACYKNSKQCVDVDAAGRSRKEVVLGIFPALKLFEYQFTEQF